MAGWSVAVYRTMTRQPMDPSAPYGLRLFEHSPKDWRSGEIVLKGEKDAGDVKLE